MSVWPVFAAGGLITFALRFSFIYTLGKIKVPAWLHRALRFVPPAVLSAIIVPEVLMPGGTISFAGSRLPAALVAAAVAFKTRKTLPTMLAGMAVFVLLNAWR